MSNCNLNTYPKPQTAIQIGGRIKEIMKPADYQVRNAATGKTRLPLLERLVDLLGVVRG